MICLHPAGDVKGPGLDSKKGPEMSFINFALTGLRHIPLITYFTNDRFLSGITKIVNINTTLILITLYTTQEQH